MGRLELRPGAVVFALVKSVAVDGRSLGGADMLAAAEADTDAADT